VSIRSKVNALGIAAALYLLVPALSEAQPTTTRVSVGPGGAQGDRDSGGTRPTQRGSAISVDGRWVAFQSEARNLVADDTNGWADIFLHDRQTATTTRVSQGEGSIQADGPSAEPVTSGDRSVIAYTSWASNLMSGDPSGDTNGVSDVLVHDRDVIVNDRRVAWTWRVSNGSGGEQANGASGSPAISADGRWVAFQSDASNLVDGDTNAATDVFLYDLVLATTTRVSVGTSGAQGNGASEAPTISADGRWVAFDSWASNLVLGDTNGDPDVFIYDRQAGTTTRVSVGSGGTQANDATGASAMSADGRWVAFRSVANNLVPGDTNFWSDVFVHDRQTGTTTRVSVGPGGLQPNGFSDFPVISADGRWVGFESFAHNLVANDTNDTADVFVHDRQTGATTLVSLGTSGTQGNGLSQHATISADGRLVAFESRASNLVSDDTNAAPDVFVRDRGDAGCAVTLSSLAAWAPADVGPGATGKANRPLDVRYATLQSVLALAPAECAWTPVSNDPSWLVVMSSANNAGVGVVDYALAANTGGPRTGTLTIGGATFTVTQASTHTPMAPEGLVAYSVVGNVVTLTWTMPPVGPRPTGFVLEGGVNSGEILASIPTGSTAPAFALVVPRGSYYLRLHALNGSFRSPASNEIRVHVSVRIAPSAPAHLVGLVKDDTLTLAWSNTYAGGAPTSFVLDAINPIVTSVAVAFGDSVTLVGVPPGTYTLALRAQNGAGSSPPSNALTLTFPTPCSGPPGLATDVRIFAVGRTVYVAWAPGTAGPAPTSYVVHVTGSAVGTVATTERVLFGTVAPGSYTVSVMTVNSCGAGPGTTPQTIAVP
jgi:Putative binding domain, N-terminal/WD40-like Beta Propeller Repeat